MGGGIAISLAIIALIIVVVAVAVMYLGGGVLGLKRERDEAKGERFDRSEHKRVTSETIENTETVGTRRDER